MTGKIFISYRRDDASAWAGRLYERLSRDFKKDQLFMDVDNIAPGLDFVRVLEDQVAQCDVLLAVIGKNWMTATNANGQRRLDDPEDFVRIEIESALKRDVRVIPVPVDGAQMPSIDELPEPLKPLARRQAWPLTHARFGSETTDLMREMGAIRALAVPASEKDAPALKVFLLDTGSKSQKYGLYALGLAIILFVVASRYGSGEKVLGPLEGDNIAMLAVMSSAVGVGLITYWVARALRK